MFSVVGKIVRLFVQVMQLLAFGVFVLATLAMLTATGMAAFGLWSWVDFPFSYNGQVIEQAGMYAQIGLTVLALGLCFFLPSNARIMQLEKSHRQFTIGMDDVARAYVKAHATDRSGLFQLSSEFDSVRERLAFLRRHPDLNSFEPAILEVAAQMSHISRELAEVYSDEKVERAREFLRERQMEITMFSERVDEAKEVTKELSNWIHEVEQEENVAAVQLQRLRNELDEILPEIDLASLRTQDQPESGQTKIIGLPTKAAE